jgi:hypothetical protein
MPPFSISGPDQVPLRVGDFDTSLQWYRQVTGLHYSKIPESGDFPVSLHAGKPGVANDTAKTSEPVMEERSESRKIAHAAFLICLEEIEEEKSRFENPGVHYRYLVHYCLPSLNLNEPDRHTLNLTAPGLHEDLFHPMGLKS